MPLSPLYVDLSCPLVHWQIFTGTRVAFTDDTFVKHFHEHYITFLYQLAFDITGVPGAVNARLDIFSSQVFFTVAVEKQHPLTELKLILLSFVFLKKPISYILISVC